MMKDTNLSYENDDSLVTTIINLENNLLLKAWSTSPIIINDETYLQLSSIDINEREVIWNFHNDIKYSSNKLYIHQLYQKVAFIFFAIVNSLKNIYEECILADSSGTGKSFFASYFIWRFFHSDDIEVKIVSDMIVWCNKFSSFEGWVYHKTNFYDYISFENFFVMDKKLLDY